MARVRVNRTVPRRKIEHPPIGPMLIASMNVESRKISDVVTPTLMLNDPQPEYCGAMHTRRDGRLTRVHCCCMSFQAFATHSLAARYSAVAYEMRSE